jgi:ribonuclease D
MPEAIWIERSGELAALAAALEATDSIGLDTEFLRERTFFPKLCLLQLAAGGEIWCVDTLKLESLEPLIPALIRADTPKIIHSARQDLEALYLSSRRVIRPVFDTQIAAACIGLKPQTGYADLVKTLLDVTVPKGQTRTDWSKRPLSRAQLEYAADDVKFLAEVAGRLMERLRALGREQWVTEDCRALEQARLYEPDPADAWKRLKGLKGLAPASRERARAIVVWREKMARTRNLPRGWILADPAVFELAERAPRTRAALDAALPQPLNPAFAEGILAALSEAPSHTGEEDEPPPDLRPTPQQKAAIERLARIVDARAEELNVSAELLAPRGELKALAMGARDTQALTGWRRSEIGEKLLDALV